MTKRLPSIGIVTTSTNSLSRGYLAYLACIDSWSKLADQIVIVDGGTIDASYDVLKQWSPTINWEIHQSPTSMWGSGGRWHAAQWTISTTEGLKILDTDWAFVLNCDYVVDLKTAVNLRSTLAENESALYATYKRFKLNENGEYYPAYPGVALNLKEIKKNSLNVGFGINSESDHLSDVPIIIDKQTRFIDPVNDAIKTVYKGKFLKPNRNLNLACMIYGHYFFDYYQVLDKLSEFWQVYNVRYAKRAVKSKEMFAFEFGLSKTGSISPKEKELKKPHLPEIKRVIENYYQPKMVGYKNKPTSAGRQSAISIYQMVRSIFFRLGSFPSIKENESWYNLKNGKIVPLSLVDIYKMQDKYLPNDYKIKWEV